MDALAVIQARRAVKHFDPAYVMSEKEMNELFSLAVLSPTAYNIQHWRFVIVKDTELRKKIRAVSSDQAQVTDSSLFIIICADIKAWEKQPHRYWRNSPKEVQDFVLSAIEGFYKNREQVQRDEAIRSCGIAAQTLMLAAKAMGYDSCPMDGFDFEAVAELINLPEDHVIAMYVAVGKGLKPAWPRSGQLALSEVVIENHF